MANKRNGRGKLGQQPQNREELLQGLEGQKPQKKELTIPAESIVMSAQISSDINNKVRGLTGGLVGLRELYGQEDENEQYADFFEKNRQTVEALMKMDLNGTYNILVENAKQRDALYKELVDKNVISKEELNSLRGIVSNTPYLRYIAALGPGKRHRAGLVELTVEDSERLSNATTDNLQGLLSQLRSENKLNDAEVVRLNEFGPKTEQHITEARNQIIAKIGSFDIRAKTSYGAKYEEINSREKNTADKFDQYIKEYNQVVSGLVEQIQEIFDQGEDDKTKAKRVNLLTRESGLPIAKGQILWGRDSVNGRPGPGKNNRIEILDITFGGVQKDPTLHQDFQILKPTLEPLITFTTQASETAAPEEYKLSAAAFQKWLEDNQVTEKIETQEQLEASLGLKDFIKPGQTLVYIDPERVAAKAAQTDEETGATAGDSRRAAIVSAAENANGVYNTVTIEKIADGKIFLNHAVRLDSTLPDNPGYSPKSSAELDFGEFARWYRKFSGVPEINELEKLDGLLVQHHQKLIKDMGWPPDHGTPIQLSDGDFPLHLISAYNPDMPHLTIASAEDGRIKMASGEELSPQQFYREVMDKGLTRPTPEQLKELLARAEAQQDKKRQAELEELAKQKDLAPDAPGKSTATGEKKHKPGKMGFFDRVKDAWANTRFLNLIEAWEVFFKAPANRIAEWLKDKSERRQFAVGKEFYKGFPKFGGLNELSNSYEDKLNGKNATDVKNWEEFFDKNYTVAKVFEKMYAAPNKYYLKACLQFLSKKGQLRWEDDKRLWNVMNKHLKGGFYPEKFHRDLGTDKYPVVVGDEEVKKRAPNIDVYDQCRAAIDGGFGAGTYDTINGTNEREYQNKKKETAEKIHMEYEYRGGIGNALKKMMSDWENGVEVKQFEFDGLLSEACVKTEIPAEQAVFLLVSAFSIKNKNGQTMLGLSRLNSYIPYLQRHQMFFFFADNHGALDAEGNPIMEMNDEGKMVPKKTKFKFENFAKVYNEVIKKDIDATGKSNFNKFTAGRNTIDWMSKNMLTDKVVKEKMAEKAGSPDIDVMYYQFLGPLIKQENLDRVIGKSYNSLQKPEVLKNMYAGYNHQLAVKARLLNTGDEDAKATRAVEFSDMINGFIYFNNVLKKRIKMTPPQPYMRMDDALFDSPPSADKKRKTIEFCTETEQFLGLFVDRVANMTGDPELQRLNQEIVQDTSSRINDEEEENFRVLLRRRILDLSKNRPEELAAMARECAVVMKGMTGAQLSASELKDLQKAA